MNLKIQSAIRYNRLNTDKSWKKIDFLRRIIKYKKMSHIEYWLEFFFNKEEIFCLKNKF